MSLRKLLAQELEVGLLNLKLDIGLRALHPPSLKGTRKNELHVSDFVANEKTWCLRRVVHRYLRGNPFDRPPTEVQYDGKWREEKWLRRIVASGMLRDYQRELTMGRLVGHPDFVVDFGRGERILELTGHDGRNDFRLLASRLASKKRQCAAYVVMAGLPKGFVLDEDKGSCERKIYPVVPDPAWVALLHERVVRASHVADQMDELDMAGKVKLWKILPRCDSGRCKLCGSP